MVSDLGLCYILRVWSFYFITITIIIIFIINTDHDHRYHRLLIIVIINSLRCGRVVNHIRRLQQRQHKTSATRLYYQWVVALQQ